MNEKAATATLVAAGVVINDTLLWNVIFSIMGWLVTVVLMPVVNENTRAYCLRKALVYAALAVIAAILINRAGAIPPATGIATLDFFFNAFWSLHPDARCFAAGYFITCASWLPTPEKMRNFIRQHLNKGARK